MFINLPVLHNFVRLGICGFAAACVFLNSPKLWAEDAAGAEPRPESLLRIGKNFDVSKIKTREAKVSVVEGGEALRIDFGTGHKYPDAAFGPSDERVWDLSKFGGVRATVTNVGTESAKVALRVDNPEKPGQKPWNTGAKEIAAGETKTIEVLFGEGGNIKMPAYPINPAEIAAFHIFVNKPEKETSVVVQSVEAFGAPSEKLLERLKTGDWRQEPVNKEPSDPVLVAFNEKDVAARISTLDSEYKVVEKEGGKALEVRFGASKPYPNITFSAAKGNWNLERFTRIEFDITNDSEESIQLMSRVDNPGASSKMNSNGGKLALDPGERGMLIVHFDRYFAEDLRKKLEGMQFTPWGIRQPYGSMLDPANVISINIYENRPSRPVNFTINGIRAAGEFDASAQVIPEPFFPFIDQYGQYRHKDWLNKIKTNEDLEKIRQQEAESLHDFPRPKHWNEYGGWADGPQLEATGSFYTTKQEGKWFLVDPSGHLFFSLGMDVVQVNRGGTPIDKREGWFADAPWEKGNEFSEFVDEARLVKHGDYEGGSPKIFDFYAANLKRKYGDSWLQTWRELMPQRLMNWGFNTIANWSDIEILKMDKIPYTHWVFYHSKKLPWQPATRNPIPDPFASDFEENLRAGALRMVKDTVNDPFCIGYFVDNELTWRADDTQGIAAMAGNASNPAKVELVKDLKAKYETAEKLNAAWGTSFADWDAVTSEKTLPKTSAGTQDLREFTAKIARKYFETVRKVMKEVAPNKLYLGCRFADHNARVVAIAAEYCDVVSFNIYRESVAAWKPAAAIDKPVIIGEFHFASTDRGVFGAGLVKADTTQECADLYFSYVTGAARNPQLVGTHWFALVDEPTTGRFLDGENHRIGFLSITDTPYQEMIEASRKAAGEIYQIRSE
ncbi:MAG: beta-galactosidase [Chthoniobacterales bacterium]